MHTTESTLRVSGGVPWWPSGYDFGLSHCHGLGSSPGGELRSLKPPSSAKKKVGGGVGRKW